MLVYPERTRIHVYCLHAGVSIKYYDVEPFDNGGIISSFVLLAARWKCAVIPDPYIFFETVSAYLEGNLLSPTPKKCI